MFKVGQRVRFTNRTQDGMFCQNVFIMSIIQEMNNTQDDIKVVSTIPNLDGSPRRTMWVKASNLRAIRGRWAANEIFPNPEYP